MPPRQVNSNNNHVTFKCNNPLPPPHSLAIQQTTPCPYEGLPFKNIWSCHYRASSETQGQIVGARESLNRRENMAQKKSKEEREECFSGTNQKPERRRPFGTGLVRHCPHELFTFLRALFFHPFRLSLAPTISPWVSEDDYRVANSCNY